MRFAILSNRHLAASLEMVEDVGLFLFRLEARTLCFELQDGDLLVISVRTKAHLMDRLRKPDASLLRDAGQRTVRVIALCGWNCRSRSEMAEAALRGRGRCK